MRRADAAADALSAQLAECATRLDGAQSERRDVWAAVAAVDKQLKSLEAELKEVRDQQFRRVPADINRGLMGVDKVRRLWRLLIACCVQTEACGAASLMASTGG